MAVAKDIVQVRIDKSIYDRVRAEAEGKKPSPSITHLINSLIAEALDARAAAQVEA